MLVDLKVTSKTKFQKGDLLICSENGVFEPINKNDLLRDCNDKIKRMEREIEHMKQFLKTYQENMTKVIKGVIDNG
jgi:predicted DNA-binding antitoxin AbrB/MazE fold protein